MKGRQIDQLVYEHLFPKPGPQQPQNFQTFLQRHLILEVRQEVHSFYGHLDTSEAKYPGLNYNNRTHRIRLSRWQWHRRLFRTFDALRLTPNEISGLTKWEGTKWAKERYEREQNCVIRDTAMDGLPVWTGGQTHHVQVDEDSEVEESVGYALNRRLRERSAARNAGDLSLPLDEAWEQWFKNAVETGEISAVRQNQRMLDHGRAGNWREIPDALQNLIRDALWAESRDLAREGRVSRGSFTVGGPLTSSQVGILSAPTLSAPTHTTTTSPAWTGLRLPGAFEADGIQRSSNPNA